jgi:hypothetical protein
LKEIFEKDSTLRDNTIIVVSNSGSDGASGIVKHVDFFIKQGSSQLDATRWSFYQFSDAIFSSSNSDILYFTGNGPDKKDIVIEKCGALMPCFHGCDAHSIDKIFKPDNNRFCWIKADPTFEGLKQTLYEPEDRVKIQTFKPDIKNDRFVISELQFLENGNLFGNQKLLINENLNAIIGGKSSGKSLLLYSAAKSIDPLQVERTSKRLKFDGYQLGAAFNFEVTWKNGDKDVLNDSENKNNKITYIPQLYINHLVEKNNKTELNDLIGSILLQDTAFKDFYEEKLEAVGNQTVEIETLLTNYFQVRNKGIEVQKKSKEIGKADAIAKSIAAIGVTIETSQRASNLSEEDFKKYTAFVTERSEAEKKIKEISETETLLAKIVNEVQSSKRNLVGDKNTADGIPVKGKVDRLVDEALGSTEDISSLITKINSDFTILLSNLNDGVNGLKLGVKKNGQIEKLKRINDDLAPYLIKIAGQQELQKLTMQLENEKRKHLEAVGFEKQLSAIYDEYRDIRVKLVSGLRNRYGLYQEITQKINETKKNIDEEILLNCNLNILQDKISFFDQVNKNAISEGNIFYKIFKSDTVDYEELLKLIGTHLTIADNRLEGEQGLSIPLRVRKTFEEVYQGLIVDPFALDYTVSYKGDDLLSMSPGKKGTVLLILFLQISSSEYPILIDQPEDNLDNRTIYELLCKIIRKKKKERQIIIVSHNANLVVSTDAENIIVANQEGQNGSTEGGRYRFEYVNGSLEHSFPGISTTTEILKQQGIKEHVCDILEGGNEAFKQRERKYSIKK